VLTLCKNMRFYYVYILESKADGKFYTGYTSDLRRRLEEHNSGLTKSTKYRLPLELVYFEGSNSSKDALKREKYLKTTYGKRYIKNRIKFSLSENLT